jgi:hypothetical protein
MDPLLVHTGGQCSELTDGFAMGVTMLVAMVGLPAANILQPCRLWLRKPEDPANWTAPALPDASAGEWPDDVKIVLATIVAGLTQQYEDERMPLSMALEQLEALCTRHGIGEEATAAALAAEREARQPPSECVVCLDAPRQQRFACGHLLCCADCVEQMLSTSLCPTCRAPLRLVNNDKAEGMRGCGAEATFEMPVVRKAPVNKKPPAVAAAVAAPAPAVSAVGRGEGERGAAGRGRGRGRGRGGRGGRGGW